jgi:hypothetical protein
MTMTGAGLFAAVKTKLGTVQDSAIQEAALKPMCEAIIEYITGNAAVSVSVPAAGIVAPNGPCTGTASGTGTVA